MDRKLRILEKLRSGEAGQSAVFITLFVMFVFIALAALAIDGGTLYLARRSLQNKSDAACLAAAVELAEGGSQGDALLVAANYMTLNGADPSWYDDDLGDGVALVEGIEVSGLDVRVALQWQVPTIFTRLIGSPPSLVGSRSHCNAEAGGGLLPIAIKRYGEDPDVTSNLGGNCEDGGAGWCTNPEGPDGIMDDVDCTNNTPPPGYSCDTRYGLDQGDDGQGANPAPWHNVVDYAKSVGSDVLDAWPQFDNPADPGDPADPQCLYLPPYSTDAGCPADDNVVSFGDPRGRAMYIVGDGALPNVASGSDFRFFITLDVRCITCGANRWYNEAFGITPTTSLNTLKNTSMAWICNGYLGLLPVPGEQVGVLSGADANQAAGEMRDCYDPGDVVSVVVYDGTVYRDVDFDLSVSPSSQSVTWDDDPIIGVVEPGELDGPQETCFGTDTGILFPNCAKYTVTLAPDGPFNSSGVILTVYASDQLYWNSLVDLNNNGIVGDVLGETAAADIVATWMPAGVNNCDIDGNNDGQADPIVYRTSQPMSAAGDVTRTFCVWQTLTQHTPMARTLFVDAFDPSTQRHHLTTARITVDASPGLQDYALALGNDPFLIVKRPNAGTQQITWDVDYESLGASVPGEPTLVWCNSSVGDDPDLPCSGGAPDVDWDFQAQGQDYRLTIRVKPSTAIDRYFFKIVPPRGSLNTSQGHFAMGGFDVVAESAGGGAGNMNSFVVVLGYAQIEILAMDANSVVGRIIHASADFEDIPLSLVPRLIPWE